MTCALWDGSAVGQVPAQCNEEPSSWKDYSNLERAGLRDYEFSKYFFLFKQKNSFQMTLIRKST